MSLTKAEKEFLHRHYKKLGKIGSAARAAKLTAEERKAIASLGGKAKKKKWDLMRDTLGQK